MITCRLDIGVDLKHPLNILMASLETDSSLTSSLLLAVLYTMHSESISDIINDLYMFFRVF